MRYNLFVMIVKTTEKFDNWLESLDKPVRIRVQIRIRNVMNGHFGDHKVFGSLGELRFKSGLRIYYMRRYGEVVILLSGGDKNSQQKDIETAKKMIEAIRKEG